jgi:spermidine/putrescine transport system permease protein
LIARSNQKVRDLLVLLVILPFWSKLSGAGICLDDHSWPQFGIHQDYQYACSACWVLAPQSFMFSCPFAVVVCLVYVHLPFMVLPLYANLEKHDMSLLDAAQDLGANAWQRFWKVTWPLSLPGVYAGAALVFIPALGIFAVPDLLGGTDGIMIGNLIKQQFLESRDWPFGSVLSIVLTLVCTGAGWIGCIDRPGHHHR